MNDTGYLYGHIRLDTNEMFYIGISLYNRTGKYSRAFNKRQRSIFWKNITAKTEYKVEIILDNLPKHSLLLEEPKYIKLYGRRDLGEGTLVNLTNGGEGVCGYKYRTKRVMAESQRLSMFGRKLSQETKDKISAKHIGLKYSQEHMDKLSHGAEIYRKAMDVSVTQKSKNGDIVKIWDHINECTSFGFSRSCIRVCCRGLRKYHRGFSWEYTSTSGNSLA
jgi:hypothetical protein